MINPLEPCDNRYAAALVLRNLAKTVKGKGVVALYEHLILQKAMQGGVATTVLAQCLSHLTGPIEEL